MVSRLWLNRSLALLLLLRDSAAIQSPTAKIEMDKGRPAKGRLAVFIGGLQERFLLRSKWNLVVGWSVRQGFDVDVFVDLVAPLRGSSMRHNSTQEKWKGLDKKAKTKTVGARSSQILVDDDSDFIYVPDQEDLQVAKKPRPKKAHEVTEELPPWKGMQEVVDIGEADAAFPQSADYVYVEEEKGTTSLPAAFWKKPLLFDDVFVPDVGVPIVPNKGYSSEMESVFVPDLEEAAGLLSSRITEDETLVDHDPVPYQVSSLESDVPDLHLFLEGGLLRRGARLIYYSLHKREVNISIPDSADERMSLYSPLSSQVGRNVLRRYQAAERMLDQAKKRTASIGKPYDFVLWTREDDQWLAPLNLKSYMEDPGHLDKIYSKDCASWHGINDKTLLFGWNAAEKILSRLFKDFWLQDAYGRLGQTRNAEEFLLEFSRMCGVESKAVPWRQMPAAVSTYVLVPGHKTPTLCQHWAKEGLCVQGDPERLALIEKPRHCPRHA